MKARPAAETDADAVQAIYAACIAAADWLPEAAKARPVFAEVSRGERVWVAVDDVGSGRVLGFVSVDAPDSFIHHLFVDAHAHGRGVGRLLLDALRDDLPLPWRLKCVRRNEAALGFYARLGWRETGGGESGHGAYAVLSFDSNLSEEFA